MAGVNCSNKRSDRLSTETPEGEEQRSACRGRTADLVAHEGGNERKWEELEWNLIWNIRTFIYSFQKCSLSRTEPDPPFVTFPVIQHHRHRSDSSLVTNILITPTQITETTRAGRRDEETQRCSVRRSQRGDEELPLIPQKPLLFSSIYLQSFLTSAAIRTASPWNDLTDKSPGRLSHISGAFLWLKNFRWYIK